MQLSAAEEADIRGLVPATNAFLGILSRAASIISGLALVSPASLSVLGSSGPAAVSGVSLRGAIAARPRGRADASARRVAPAAPDVGSQALDLEAISLLCSSPQTFSFRLGAALGGHATALQSRRPATPHLDDTGAPSGSPSVDAVPPWWLSALRHGYAIAGNREDNGSAEDGRALAALSTTSTSQQPAWPAIPFSEPSIAGLASSVTAVDASGRSVASLPLTTGFSSSQPSLASLIELHLPDCGLVRLDGLGLSACTALRVLDVSFNSLTTLQVRKV